MDEYPILTKNNGPEGINGRIIGVDRAKVYIRKPRPETAPITEPHEWIPLFDRCLAARERAREAARSAIHSETEAQPIDPTLPGLFSSIAEVYVRKLST